MFTCEHCTRSYQRKLYFERHVITCEFLSKTKKERALESEELADTPSVRELYSIIMTLAAKCTQLETKLTAINKWVHITKQKLNIIDWLNTTYLKEAAAAAEAAAVSYDDWLLTLQVGQKDLQVLFTTDYVGGVTSFLKQHLSIQNDEAEARPIRAFTGKENTFYICNKTWLRCEEAVFTKLMYTLDQQFLREFIVWQNQNKNRMATDDSFSDVYAKNMKKVMGGAFTREQLYSRIKKDLYQHLREDPPNIVEYETTF